MSRVTSKLQVSIPKAVADEYGIRPGDDIVWQPAGETIRVLRAAARPPRLDVAARLELFDLATERQRRRESRDGRRRRNAPPRGRGWTREELYVRGGAD
jgi:AbrB family looped-hinge helix DNA binding protein